MFLEMSVMAVLEMCAKAQNHFKAQLFFEVVAKNGCLTKIWSDILK